MKIPHKVRLTHDKSVRVVWVDGFDQPDRVGEFCFDTYTISIKRGLSKKETLETFIHELIHAVCDYHAIYIPHKSIYELEGPLRRLLSLNPWLRKSANS